MKEGALDEAIVDAIAAATLAGADSEYGGWGHRDTKFPNLLATRIDVCANMSVRPMQSGGMPGLRALDAMASGGMRDHLNGWASFAIAPTQNG